jgi:hypothetical protein
MTTKNDRGKVFCFIFFLSLLLSAISFISDSIIGRDGLLYVETALLAQTDIRGALANFDWPWFSIFIGWLSKGSGIEPEYLWRIISEFMTSVACTVTVDVVYRKRPESVFWAALLVLSVPAFNNYRGDIIRENGFWCFSMCALWMAFAYEENKQKKYISGMVVAILIAASFRPEALAFLLIYPAWKGMRSLPANGVCQVSRRFQIVSVAGVIVILMAGYLIAQKCDLLPDRLCRFGMIAINFLDGIWSTAAALAKVLPYKYSREDAELILFFGIFFYLVWKIIKIFGPFSIPVIGNFVFGNGRKKGDADSASYQENPWLVTDIAAWIYFAILAIFTIYHQFVSSRYLALMGFLLLPRIAENLNRFITHWPRLKTTVFIISAIVALANVTHINPPKNHLRETGIWIGKNLEKNSDIYLDDARLAYYAGWLFFPKTQDSLDTALAGPYSHFVIEVSNEDEARKLSEKGLVAIQTIRNRDKKIYMVFRKNDL